MDSKYLAGLLEQPSTHAAILGKYHGPYSLGITRCSRTSEELGFQLRVAGPTTEGFPEFVEIDGNKIKLIVKPNFVIPEALSTG